MARIRPTFPENFVAKKAKKDADYLAWLHDLPCASTGVTFDIQAAHVSFPALEYGAFGRGKSSKASDMWALPLTASEHARQHARGDERSYWSDVGRNPHLLCLVLFGLFTQYGDDGLEMARKIILERRLK